MDTGGAPVTATSSIVHATNAQAAAVTTVRRMQTCNRMLRTPDRGIVPRVGRFTAQLLEAHAAVLTNGAATARSTAPAVGDGAQVART